MRYVIVILVLLTSFVFGEKNIAVSKLNSNTSKALEKKLTKKITKAVKKDGSFSVMDNELIGIIANEKGLNTHCFNDKCYQTLGQGLGVDYILYGSFSSSKKYSSITLSLFSNETEAIEVNHTFSYTSSIKEISDKKINSDIKKFLNNDFHVKSITYQQVQEQPKTQYQPQKITSNENNIEHIYVTSSNIDLKVGETKKISYSVSPKIFEDKVIITNDNKHVVELDGETIKGLSIGTATLKLTSQNNPVAKEIITITVSITPKINLEEKKQTKSVEISKKSTQTTIAPYLMMMSQYNGPTIGGGIAIGFKKNSSKHYFGFELDYGYMPDFYYNGNSSFGAGIVYTYEKIISTNSINLDIGGILGYWSFKNDKYSNKNHEEAKYVLHNKFLYIGGPKVITRIGKYVSIDNTMFLGLEESHEGVDNESFMGNPSFKGISAAIRSSIRVRFNL